MKKKFYAIKEGRGVKNKIVDTWLECEPLVKGYNAVYKSFTNEDDAKEYLKIVDVVEVKEQTNWNIDKKKKVKATTRMLQARIPKELYEQFTEKCEDIGQDADIVIKNLIDEWVS